MKARVKATGEVVEITSTSVLGIQTNKGFFLIEELEGIEYELDYWEKLKHQAAISAMQGILAEDWCSDSMENICVEKAVRIATALVEKMK